MNIGIGTYTIGGVANYFGLGPSLREKFQTIREMGYNSVELLSTDLMNDIGDIIKWRDEFGLTITSIHAEPTEDIIKAMAALGGKAVIWAGTPFCNQKEAIEVAKQLDEMAEMAAPYGIKIGYHNHNWEFYFTEGKTLLEHIADNSNKCYFQLDCGWAMYGGMYPPNFIRKYRDRILAIHVKENCRVKGAGGIPASKYAPQDDQWAKLKDVILLPVEERQKIMDMLIQSAADGPMDLDMSVQCRLGAPESNIDWHEVKKALDEQSFEAFWIVERENFYDKEKKCLADDCAWIRANIEQ